MQMEVRTTITWMEATQAIRKMYEHPMNCARNFCRRDAAELRMVANGIDRLLDEAEGKPCQKEPLPSSGIDTPQKS